MKELVAKMCTRYGCQSRKRSTPHFICMRRRNNILKTCCASQKTAYLIWLS